MHAAHLQYFMAVRRAHLDNLSVVSYGQTTVFCTNMCAHIPIVFCRCVFVGLLFSVCSPVVHQKSFIARKRTVH